MTEYDADRLATRPASEVLRDTDAVSVGSVRILNDSAGTPGEERPYEAGDEALVEGGHAEWVVAPVHLPAAGRRLDGDAEREQIPAGGIEVYPPAEPTTAARRAEARRVGYVDAHSDEGVGEKLAARRAEVARSRGGRDDGDVARQASLGGHGARSGPVTAPSDLPADEVPAEADQPAAGKDSGPATAKKAAPAKASGKE
jgi:hypothetical protein